MKPIKDEHELIPNSYSRAKAIKEGKLIDITRITKRMGFFPPTAVTKQVWEEVINLTKDNQEESGIETDARLTDLLTTLNIIIVHEKADRFNFMEFDFLVDDPEREDHFVTLLAYCEEGDQGEPVMTIKLKEE